MDPDYIRNGTAQAQCPTRPLPDHTAWDEKHLGRLTVQVAGCETCREESVGSPMDPFVLLRPSRQDDEIVDFVYEYANDAACDANVLWREELVGTRMLERLTQLAPVGLADAYINVFHTGEPLVLHDFAQPNRRAGEPGLRFFDVRALKAGDLLLLTWRDVTVRDRDAAERARLVAIVRSSDDAIVSLDGELRITAWNSGAERIYGYAAKEVLGASIDMLIPTDGAGHDAGVTMITRDIGDRTRATRALAVSDERYREILAKTPDGVWRLDAEHHTSYVNPRMASMLGYAPEEMIGHKLSDYMDSQQLEVAVAELAKARSEGGSLVTENCFRRKDGSPCWVRVSHNAQTDQHGNPAGALAIMSDITSSKAQAVELRATERFLAALTDSIADGICGMNRDGRLTYMNQAAEALLGWTQGGSATARCMTLSTFSMVTARRLRHSTARCCRRCRRGRQSASRTIPSPAVTAGCCPSPTVRHRSSSTVRSKVSSWSSLTPAPPGLPRSAG